MEIGQKNQSDLFKIGKTWIHLPRHSDLIHKHHLNWLVQAIHSLDREKTEDLHYTGVVSLSRQDLRKIKSILLKAVEVSENCIKDSREEVLVGLSINLFALT